jgi:hypothetical protein
VIGRPVMCGFMAELPRLPFISRSTIISRLRRLAGGYSWISVLQDLGLP